MLVHPQIDPVAISLGPVSIHWYGLMYLIGFLLFFMLGRYRIKYGPKTVVTNELLDDILFYGMLGVIIGGRLGHVLFYQFGYYLENPLSIFAIWEGGMSFHGGFLGVIVAMVILARKHGVHWLNITDFGVPLVPLGLGAGRIGNFINGELWGRPTDVSWGMVFPYVDDLPRHPSQLYQFFLEGIVLFLLVWIYSSKSRPMGAVTGMFMIGYGVVRSIAEFFREPTEGFMGLLTFGVSMGQWLSIPMIMAGAALIVWAGRQPQADNKPVATTTRPRRKKTKS
ncbi:Prolipoprotein diacylglyceryl transferase [Nitrosomonas marina]|uniref:Phosphatidylglycerol--prolipoprotein diacylglyceryl transferase n=1 Tax=Nitrosomonas marina TaxID=917 RepID=A0A1I0DY30_9PROT|nr:prolipoprotein diacylglyceryl transferase [Nitrosomonas marina]SET37164.1 Prolipoprotein diacylglyceryl transferase [Nitrosomonas marina]